VSTKNKQKYNKIDRVFGHATLPVVCFLATVLVPVQLLRSTVLMLLRGLARRPMNHDEMMQCIPQATTSAIVMLRLIEATSL